MLLNKDVRLIQPSHYFDQLPVPKSQGSNGWIYANQTAF